MKLTLAAVLSLPLLLTAPDIQSDLRKADRHYDRGNWAAAAEAYAKVTEADPAQGKAWYQLGAAFHQLGSYEKASAANERAAAFPDLRHSALYNLACAQTLAGHIEKAAKSLEAALAAGFVDFDNMAVDTDITPHREAGRVPFAPERTYTEYVFRNGIKCAYDLQLPPSTEPDSPRQALVCFAPGGGGPKSADWFTAEFFGDSFEASNWIVIVLVAPEKGWMTHPAHHALEGLLKKLRKEHVIEGKFHALGYAEGARPAATYARMSRKYFATLTTIASRGWASWDDVGKSFRDGMPVHLIAGEGDRPALNQAKAVEEDITKHKGKCRLTIVPDDARLMPSLRRTALLAAFQPK